MHRIIIEIRELIAKTTDDRLYFRELYQKTRNHGHSIEAAACAIREKALRDALNVVIKESRRD